LGGSAENGRDYETISSSIMIPAGRDSVEISVVGRQDAETEGAETVIARILPGELYDISQPDTATVSIWDSGHTPRFRPTQLLLQPDGTMVFVVETPKPGNYALEASEDLKQWSTLEVIASSQPIVEFKDQFAKPRERFYRIRFTPP